MLISGPSALLKNTGVELGFGLRIMTAAEAEGQHDLDIQIAAAELGGDDGRGAEPAAEATGE